MARLQYDICLKPTHIGKGEHPNTKSSNSESVFSIQQRKLHATAKWDKPKTSNWKKQYNQ
jgi:hypothetical protein